LGLALGSSHIYSSSSITGGYLNVVNASTVYIELSSFPPTLINGGELILNSTQNTTAPLTVVNGLVQIVSNISITNFTWGGGQVGCDINRAISITNLYTSSQTSVGTCDFYVLNIYPTQASIITSTTSRFFIPSSASINLSTNINFNLNLYNNGNITISSGTPQIANFTNNGNFALNFGAASIANFTNFGVTSITQGTTLTGSVFTNQVSATLQGLGTIQSNLVNNGIILIGGGDTVSFTGNLTILSLTLSPSSVINSAINGNTAQIDYPQLIITQNAQLDGDYTFYFLGSYIPNTDTFTPLVFQGSRVGYFVDVELSQGPNPYVPVFSYTTSSFSFTQKTCASLVDCASCSGFSCFWCPATATCTSDSTSCIYATDCTNCTSLSTNGCVTCTSDNSCSYCRSTDTCLFRSTDYTCVSPPVRNNVTICSLPFTVTTTTGFSTTTSVSHSSAGSTTKGSSPSTTGSLYSLSTSTSSIGIIFVTPSSDDEGATKIVGGLPAYILGPVVAVAGLIFLVIVIVVAFRLFRRGGYFGSKDEY